MTSTGNDIVALNGYDVCRSGEARFYTKILEQSELNLYCREKFTGLSFQNYVWLLWSIKEAAYKYQKRNNHALLFSPKKIVIQNVQLTVNHLITQFGVTQVEVSLQDCNAYCNCKVIIGKDVLYSKSAVYGEVIHTVVNNGEDFKGIQWGLKYVNNADYENQSRSVRLFILDRLSALFPNEILGIQKSGSGYPVVVINSKIADIPLSFAHHQNFVGYSFLFQNT